MMRIKTSLISLSIFLLFILPAAFADYSDVLLVANSNSPVSLKIADYFQANRPNLTHRLNISTPEAECNNFSTVNATMLQPIKAYLNSTNDTINYIVLTKGFPLYTCGDVLDYFGANWSLNANASSVDSELALINGPYESYIGARGRFSNPYYGSSSRFSRAAYGIYLVTRLDAYNYGTVERMINQSSRITKADLWGGLHVLADGAGYGSWFGTAYSTLSSAGLNVYYTSSSPAYPANQQNVSYFDTFGCYSFGGCNDSYMGNPNYTWKNGSIASARYSFSARTTTYPTPADPFMSANRSFIADYLGEGATAGLGYAVEPLTSGTASPNYIAQNYVNGYGMAEMLWSSIPHLSWSAVVFGDPKASYPVVQASVYAPDTHFADIGCNVTLDYSFASSMNVSIEWYKNGTNQTSLAASYADVPVGVPVMLANISSSQLSQSDSWQCNANVFLGQQLAGNAISSAVSLDELNFTAAAGVYPSDLVSTDTLFCNATISDLVHGYFNVSYAWCKGGDCPADLGGTVRGVPNGVPTVVGSLAPGNLSEGDSWSCHITVFTGLSIFSGQYLGRFNSSSILVSQFATASRISPASPTVSQDLFGYCNVSTQLHVSKISYAWYSGGAITASGEWAFTNGTSNSDIAGCTLRQNDSRVLCWGDNTAGRVGDGTWADSWIPKPTADSSPYSLVSAAYGHACGIRQNDSRVLCWGDNSNGDCGAGTVSTIFTPTQTLDSSSYSALSAGWLSITCGIRQNDSRVLCWGNNAFGAIGDGTITDALVPTLINDTSAYSSVSADFESSCGIRQNDSRILCWGGYAAISPRNNPAPVNSTDAFTSVSVLNLRACAIRANDSRILCWYWNIYNDEDWNLVFNITNPVPINDTSAYLEVSVGDGSTCALRNDSRILCWNNSGFNISAYTPASVDAGYYNHVSAGYGYMCASRANDSRIMCWGSNYRGNLGDGTNTTSPIPVLTQSNATHSQFFVSGREYSTALLSSSLGAGSGWLFSCSASSQRAHPYVNSTRVEVSGEAMGNATDISASGISNLSVAVNNSSNTGGIAFGDNASVSISANGLPIISFGFNFSASSLNLSAISINNSTVGGKSFFSVSGIDSSALVGGKTIVIYGASSSYNAVCIKGQENVSFDQISASCTGENETIVACDGAPHAGMQCSLSGNALTVSGLNYSGVLQFQYTAPAAPPASSGSSGGGGGGGGGGGSVSSGMSGAWQMVDIGMNRSCNVTVTRRLSSAANLSVLTTIISNPEGNNCTMDDFLFLDSIPSGFAAISETNFTPPYASLDGRLAGFVFPSFAPGESKTIAYSVAKWAKPSELALFSNYSLSAKKQVPAVPLPEEGAAPGHERNESPPPSAEPGNYSLFPLVQPNANGSQAGRSAQSAGISIMAIAAMLLAMAAIVAMVAIYLMAMPKPAKKRKAVRPKVP